MDSKQKKSSNPNDALKSSYHMKGRLPLQDAYFTLHANNTVSVLVHESGIRSYDLVVSARQAKRKYDDLLKKGWQLVSQPRRTEEQIRMDIKTAGRKFLARPFRLHQEPDPDANLVPPARQIKNQRERLNLRTAACTPGKRMLQGGAFETNKRRH